MSVLIVTVFSMVLALAQAAMAELYKWSDSQGNLHVTDTPPPASRSSTERSTPAPSPLKAPSTTPSVDEGVRPRFTGKSAPTASRPATISSPWQEGVQSGTAVPVQSWKDEAGVDHYTDVVPTAKPVGNGAAKIEEATAHRQKLTEQSRQWESMSGQQRRELQVNADRVKEEEKQAWDSASPRERRASMMKALAPVLEQMTQACESGKGDNCLTIAVVKRQDGDIPAARKYYQLGCRQGDQKACAQQVVMEAVQGSPREARSLMSMLCPGGAVPDKSAKDACSKLRPIVDALHPPSKTGKYLPEAVSKYVGGDANILQAPFPVKLLEQQGTLAQAATPSSQADASGRAFSHGLQALLGINMPVDLARAAKRFTEAQAGNFPVGDRLFETGMNVQRSGGAGMQQPQDLVILRYKTQLLFKQACDRGHSQACFNAALIDQDFL